MTHLNFLPKNTFAFLLCLVFAAIAFVSCSEEENPAPAVNYTLNVAGQTVSMTDAGSGAVAGTVKGLTTNTFEYAIEDSEGNTYTGSSELDLTNDMKSAVIGEDVKGKVTDLTMEAGAKGKVQTLSQAYLDFEWKAPEVNVTFTLNEAKTEIAVKAQVVQAVMASPKDPENPECTDTNLETLWVVGTGAGGWDRDETNLMARESDDNWIYVLEHENVSKHFEKLKIVNSECWADGEWAIGDEPLLETIPIDQQFEGATISREYDFQFRKIDVELEPGTCNKITDELTTCGPDRTDDVKLTFLTDEQKNDYNNPIYNVTYKLDLTSMKFSIQYTIVTPPTQK
ncbi:hypothetical protein [Persicobacter diffluens]|uniref:Uncharacterized protein n=1 Tax=Persicobacter diffluens TaxID=981 RepID=A0AAN5AMD6_9BACT|nr:hypothetical protein PEDI_48660 [Persicobacter diffluens]